MPNNELKDFKQRFEEGEFAQSAELSTRYLDENILIFDNIRVLANPDSLLPGWQREAQHQRQGDRDR